MKISFVIPAHNEEKVIGKCLESVKDEISKYSYETEIVVVNNASTDRTTDIAKSFKDVRVVDEHKKSLVYARKCGMEHSSGEIIANIDSDVILPDGWLKKVMDEFEADDTLVALSGPYIYYDLTYFERFLVRIFYHLAFFLLFSRNQFKIWNSQLLLLLYS